MEAGIEEKVELKKVELSDNEKKKRDREWFNKNLKGLKQVYLNTGYAAVYECKVMEYGTSRENLDRKIRKKYENYEDFFIGRII